jgi:hypothetical protein
LKVAAIKAIKFTIPIAFGIGLIWLFYDALCEPDKKKLFEAFKSANYIWVLLSLSLGWLSHAVRAYRQKYLLKPLGYNISFWNAYHALMIGYLINLAFPRAGELSRAGILSKTEHVPFEKGFGAILAERAVDVFMLGLITVLMLVLQIDKYDLFIEAKNNFQSGNGSCGNTYFFTLLGSIVKWLIITGFFTGMVLFILKRDLRLKIIEKIKGLFSGVFSIFKSNQKISFIGHTLLIWGLYIAMFSVCFYGLQSTSHLGLDAMLAGFVAGTVGMILVQGGIGVYPAFVGLIISIYLPASDGAIINPQALALGWIIWTSQTLMMIILGLISLLINGRNIKLINAK